jgi:type I restriction enzyme S subunit
VKKLRLGEIAESLPCDYGDDPSEDAPAYAVAKVSNVSGEGEFHGEFEKRRFREDQIAGLLVKEGELLVVKSSGSKANILSGKTAICDAARAGKLVASNFLLRLRVDDSVAFPRFVWYVLNSGASKAFVKTIVGASTYPNLKWSLYASHPIHLPPLPEQKRIAEILDRAEALRAKRRAALSQLDTLTQSIFLDLFGDPRLNKKRHPVVRLDALTREGDTINYGVVQPGDDVEAGVPLIRVGDLVEGIQVSNLKRISPTIEQAYKRSRLRGNEILVSCVGSIGVVALATPEFSGFNIARAVARIPLSDKANRDFMATYLRTSFVQDYFITELRTVSQPTLNIKQISETSVVLPPIDLQHEFARRAAAVEKLKTAHRQSLAEIDALFASLQHRAFRGEL